jgi:very-short-patch-repair endonuclease
MNSLIRDMSALGTVVATHELLARGHTQMALRTAAGHGAITRVRKGWYSLPALSPDEQAAARVGGRLACISAAVSLGLWVPRHKPVLHVSVSANACQLRDRRDFRQRLADQIARDVEVHWTDVQQSGSRTVVGAIEALAQICACADAEFAYVVCESALYQERVSRTDFLLLLTRLPSRLGHVLRTCASKSESGTESMFAFRMRESGIAFRQQVWIGPDRVDFVIGERLVVEIDSLEFHDPTVDCLRDCRLSIGGYRVLRFMYSQIVDAWPSVLASVLAAMSRGDHLAA